MRAKFLALICIPDNYPCKTTTRQGDIFHIKLTNEEIFDKTPFWAKSFERILVSSSSNLFLSILLLSQNSSAALNGIGIFS